MEKKQYDLFLEILRRFNKAGILHNIILIGSWCIYLYKDYFSGTNHIDHMIMKTRDVDFLIDRPDTIKVEVDVPELLKDLGFVTIFKGNRGYIKLDHPDLLVEFLVPDKGKGVDKPIPLKKLRINATALRFLNFLTDNTIKIKVDDFYVTVPHPVNFALHKIIVFQRRVNKDKSLKDKDAAVKLLWALIIKKEQKALKHVFENIPQKWQKKIIKGLEEAQEEDILNILR